MKERLISNIPQPCLATTEYGHVDHCLEFIHIADILASSVIFWVISQLLVMGVSLVSLGRFI